jgi:hypothetical protein
VGDTANEKKPQNASGPISTRLVAFAAAKRVGRDPKSQNLLYGAFFAVVIGTILICMFLFNKMSVEVSRIQPIPL